MRQNIPNRPDGVAVLAVLWFLGALYTIYSNWQGLTSNVNDLPYLSTTGINSWYTWAVPVAIGTSVIGLVLGLAQIINVVGLWRGKSYSYKLSLILMLALSLANFSVVGWYASAPSELGLGSNDGVPLFAAIVEGFVLLPIIWGYFRTSPVRAFLGITNTLLETSNPIDDGSSPSLLDHEFGQLGSCPKCHCEDTKVIKSSVDWLCFKCRHCGFIFAQEKAPPHYYLQVIQTYSHKL